MASRGIFRISKMMDDVIENCKNFVLVFNKIRKSNRQYNLNADYIKSKLCLLQMS
jgi:hypothetical protein